MGCEMTVSNTSAFTMSLPSLPNEPILDISKHLSPKELNHLPQSNRHFTPPPLHRPAPQDINVQAVLKWAVNHRYENLVRLLLQMGVDIKRPRPASDWGNSAPYRSKTAFKTRVLLENKANRRSLQNATILGSKPRKRTRGAPAF